MYRELILLAASAGTVALPAQAEQQPAMKLEPVIITALVPEKVLETIEPVTVLRSWASLISLLAPVWVGQ